MIKSVPGPPAIRLKFIQTFKDEDGNIIYRTEETIGGKLYNGKAGHVYLDFQIKAGGVIVTHARYNITERKMESPNDGSWDFVDLKFLKAREKFYIIDGTIMNRINDDLTIFFEVYAEFEGMWFHGLEFTELP